MSFKNIATLVTCFMLSLVLADCASWVPGIESFKGKEGIEVEGRGDDLESEIKVTSYRYRCYPSGLSSRPYDYFFRAYIDKGSGQKQYQIYTALTGGQWINWDQATYLRESERMVLSATKVGSDVQCFEMAGCIHREDVVVALEEAGLEYMARHDVTMRFSSSTVSARRDVLIESAEARHFLEVVGGLSRALQ